MTYIKVAVIVCLTWCTLNVVGQHYRRYGTEKPSNQCRDITNTRICRIADRRQRICRHPRKRNLCRKTCNLCPTTEPKDVKSQNQFHLDIDPPRCKDEYEFCEQNNICKILKRNRRRLKKICAKTCGLCRASAPPQCYSSRYGCCWNYVTPAMGPAGKGCGPCGDNDKFPMTCFTFKSYCLKSGISGKWMRSNCPNRCGHCKQWAF